MPTSRKRLVLFVEGRSDGSAAVVFVKRLLAQHVARPLDFLTLDAEPFRIQGIHNLTGKASEKWIKFLAQARKRDNVAGILVILDGDAKVVHLKNEISEKIGKQAFCARDTAINLAERAKSVGAGAQFTLCCVFAVMEFESWFLAGIKSLSAARVEGLEAGILTPEEIERIRGAKEWLGKHMPNNYKPSIHQLPMSKEVDLTEIREQNLRSFRRLENAIDELVTAFRTGKHIVTPA